MKIALKIIGMIVGLIAMVAIGGITYLNTNFPKDFEVEVLTLPTDSLRIAHGDYLANHVMVCTDCHSKRDMSFYSGKIYTEHLGAGGKAFNHERDFPGDLYPTNLTPTGKGDWTNEELYKAIVGGIHKDGHALFPIMPYQNYRQLDKSDILDVIAYIRTLPPLPDNYPTKPQQLDFPLSLIVKTIPTAPDHQSKPDASDKVAYGKYLITAASCMDCHTPQEQGEYILSKMFAGGMEFKLENGKFAVSANITPDELTGIGKWTEDDFVQRFKQYESSLEKLNPNDYNTEMPWGMYTGMKENDLRSIYAYLRTVTPVENAIVKFK